MLPLTPRCQRAEELSGLPGLPKIPIAKTGLLASFLSRRTSVSIATPTVRTRDHLTPAWVNLQQAAVLWHNHLNHHCKLLILRHSMLSQLPLVSSWQHSRFLRLAQLMLAICSFPCAVYLATNPLPLLHSNDMYDVPFLQVHLHLNKQQHLQ